MKSYVIKKKKCFYDIKQYLYRFIILFYNKLVSIDISTNYIICLNFL